jgi:hypothetical protein
MLQKPRSQTLYKKSQTPKCLINLHDS